MKTRLDRRSGRQELVCLGREYNKIIIIIIISSSSIYVCSGSKSSNFSSGCLFDLRERAQKQQVSLHAAIRARLSTSVSLLLSHVPDLNGL